MNFYQLLKKTLKKKTESPEKYFSNGTIDNFFKVNQTRLSNDNYFFILF